MNFVYGIICARDRALFQCRFESMRWHFWVCFRLPAQHLLEAKTLGFVIDSNIDDDAPFGVLVRLLRNDQYGIAPD